MKSSLAALLRAPAAAAGEQPRADNVPGATDPIETVTLVDAVEDAKPDSAGASAKPADHAPEPQSKSADDPNAEALELAASAVEASKIRIRDILEAPAAEGREKQAMKLALDTNLSVQEAIAVLEAGPKAAKAASGERQHALGDAMRGFAADLPPAPEGQSEADPAARMVNSHRKAFGGAPA